MPGKGSPGPAPGLALANDAGRRSRKPAGPSRFRRCAGNRRERLPPQAFEQVRDCALAFRLRCNKYRFSERMA